MSGIVYILRCWNRRLMAPLFLVVLCAGCYHASPPSDEWLKENFDGRRADFDSVVAIGGSVAGDDDVRYPPDTTTFCNPETGEERMRLLWNDADSLFVARLGDERRVRLDALLRRIGCTRLLCYPPSGVIDLVCYTYGDLDGFTVQYSYCRNRRADMVFNEGRDLHEMWREYTLDKTGRPISRMELDGNWIIEYCP